jgi:signal peptidase II
MGQIGERIGRKRDLLSLIIAVLVLAADQFTKSLIRANMSPGQSIPEEGIFRLTYVTNTGGAFGLFANQTFLLLFTAILGVGAILLYYRYLPFDSLLLKSGLALQLGGAIGNLLDRLRYGHVTDFVYVRIWRDFYWPAFNVADFSIVTGVIVLACSLLFFTKEKSESA